MVTVTGFIKRKNSEGKEFNVLELQGELEMLRSRKTGKYYASARTCTVTSTFNEVVCQGLIGKTIPGSIEKMDCDPYKFVVKETGEELLLDYEYYYSPTERTMEQEVFQPNILKAAA